MENEELICRGYCIDRDAWTFGFYQFIHGKHFIYDYDYSPFSFQVSQNSVSRFTGCFDKKRNKIFEKDIVKCGYGVGVVIFSNGCFMVKWIDDNEAEMEFIFSRKGRYARNGEDEFEIIGNTINNPEMLK
jgi:hypothetical protein